MVHVAATASDNRAAASEEAGHSLLESQHVRRKGI